MQLTRSDWNATPRRNRMEIWWWLTDVEADRGAMRIMPGSMNTVMDHFEQELSPQQKVRVVLIENIVLIIVLIHYNYSTNV